MKLLLSLSLALLYSATGHAIFTLNNSAGASFRQDKVKVRVASVSGNCNNSGTTVSELSGLIHPAITKFWNTVPTSRLVLEDGGYYETSDNTFITGELCLTTTACGGTPIPEVSEIVITCNTNSTNFPGGSSLLALTLPTTIKGKSIKGSVIAINASNSSFGNLSHDRKVAVIAHEIGHAFGLGHATEEENLMYYAIKPTQRALGYDDVKGVTYLYPVQIDLMGSGCFGNTISDGPPPSGGILAQWLTVGAGLAIALVLGRRSRPGP